MSHMIDWEHHLFTLPSSFVHYGYVVQITMTRSPPSWCTHAEFTEIIYIKKDIQVFQGLDFFSSFFCLYSTVIICPFLWNMVLYFKTCCIFPLFYCNHTSLFVEHGFIFQVRHATFFMKDGGGGFPFFCIFNSNNVTKWYTNQNATSKKKRRKLSHKHIHV